MLSKSKILLETGKLVYTEVHCTLSTVLPERPGAAEPQRKPNWIFCQTAAAATLFDLIKTLILVHWKIIWLWLTFISSFWDFDLAIFDTSSCFKLSRSELDRFWSEFRQVLMFQDSKLVWQPCHKLSYFTSIIVPIHAAIFLKHDIFSVHFWEERCTGLYISD